MIMNKIKQLKDLYGVSDEGKDFYNKNKKQLIKELEKRYNTEIALFGYLTCNYILLEIDGVSGIFCLSSMKLFIEKD